jgi:hypothetical protein
MGQSRHTRMWCVLLPALAATLAACSHTTPPDRAGSTESPPPSSPPGSPTASAGGATPTRPNTAATPTGAHGPALAFAEFWARRASLVDTAVTLDATARFDLQCPPPPANTPCTASAYLADDNLTSLPPNPEGVAIRLYDHGRPVSCSAATIAGLTCAGWRESARYRVHGTVRHQTAQGKQLPGLELDVIDSVPRD